MGGCGGDLSYRQLDGLADELAGRIASVLPPGAVLACALESRRATALALLASIRLDCPLMPVDCAMPIEQQRALNAQAGNAAWLGAAPEPTAPRLSPRLVEPESDAPVAPGWRHGGGFRLIVPTGGSSGTPKAAMLDGRRIAAAVAASRRRIPLEPGDCWLCCLPLHHIGGLSIPLRCLQAGAAWRLHQRFHPERVWAEIAGGRVSHVSLVPAMLARLLELGTGRPPPQLAHVLVGGAALHPELARRAHQGGWPLRVSYGLTEAGSQAATDVGKDAGVRPGRVGPPLPGVRVRIENPDAQGVGRIALAGRALMAGYLRAGLEPGAGLHGGWFVTGDLGRMEEDGALSVLGRADDLFVSGGENVHPLAVENTLLQCPGVTGALVSAVPDARWGDRLVALYSGAVDPDALEVWCRQRLAGARRPRRFLQLAQLPELASGKPDRRRARELALARFASRENAD